MRNESNGHKKKDKQGSEGRQTEHQQIKTKLNNNTTATMRN